MTPVTAGILWGVGALMAFSAIHSALYEHQFRRAARQCRDLAWWARSTMLMVTERDGTVQAWTLEQLHRQETGLTTMWIAPVMVTLRSTTDDPPKETGRGSF